MRTIFRNGCRRAEAATLLVLLTVWTTIAAVDATTASTSDDGDSPVERRQRLGPQLPALNLVASEISEAAAAADVKAAFQQQQDFLPSSPSFIVHTPGHTKLQHVTSPLPYKYISEKSLPESFCWDNVNGTNYLTKSLNQHVPQWCGSCWAHGAMSSLADRIKIARNAAGDDIHLSIQYILNCGADVAGSCAGGTASGAYQFIRDTGFVPFETCQPYIACSENSTHGFCPYVNTSCGIPSNTCKTCTMKIEPSLHPFGEVCREIDFFPNATVAEYGVIRLEDNNNDVATVMTMIQAEIWARGPVAASVHGAALHHYRGGIFNDESAPRNTTHCVSIVGWGVHYDEDDTKQEIPLTHWIVRNSWGQYFGEMGYFRILAGSNVLGIEESIAWATPGYFTIENWPCSEDGKDCGPTSIIGTPRSTRVQHYIDPSSQLNAIQRRLVL